MFLENKSQDLWQWNTGQKIILDDSDIALSVDHANLSTNNITAIRCDVVDGKYISIPDTLLQSSGRLWVYLNRVSDGNVTTVSRHTYAIINQPKPNDYVEPEDILVWHKLDERITRLEQGGTEGDPGAEGGYYTPVIHQMDADRMEVTWQGSQMQMPQVEPVYVQLPQGPAGKSPTKGVDYFTAQDKQELVNEVEQAIPEEVVIQKSSDPVPPGARIIVKTDETDPLEVPPIAPGDNGKVMTAVDGQPQWKASPIKTPVKGVDYFTEADKQEMQEAVKAEIKVPASASDLPAKVPAGLPPETPETAQGVMDALAAKWAGLIRAEEVYY